MPFPGTSLPRERWTRTRVPLGPRGRAFDWTAAFGREAPHVVDLGCGNGRFLIASAIARPGVDHLGIDLVPPAVKFGSLRAGQRGLTNAKFAWGDAVEFVLERALPGSIDEAHLYHPQPYFDRSRAARRQLGPAVLLAVHRALAPGGLFVFQTDNPAYAAYARKTVPRLFAWREHEGPWPDAPRGRTLREIVARSKGLAVVRATATRLDLGDDEASARAEALPEPDFDANRAGFESPRRARGRRGAADDPSREPPPAASAPRYHPVRGVTPMPTFPRPPSGGGGPTGSPVNPMPPPKPVVPSTQPTRPDTKPGTENPVRDRRNPPK